MFLNDVRRVVTGATPEGKSVFVSDGSPPSSVELEFMPGYKLWTVWATDDVAVVPTDGHDDTPSMDSFSPGPSGTRFLIMRWPAATDSADPGAGHDTAEFANKMPGIAETTETSGDPMMHTTDSIDYGVILSGELWVELDDGAEAHLTAGDCFVQNGTRHAWRIRGTEPCVMAVVMVGAQRK